MPHFDLSRSFPRLPPLLAGLAMLCAPLQARPLPSVPDSVFVHLKATHPRLILSDSLIQSIKTRVAATSSLQPAVNDMREKSDSLLNVPVCVYSVVDGSLLQVSRTVLERIYLLGFMAHYDNNRNYADRAARELLAASQFKDWNPAHFLDVAEMAHAFAIGYDWLYPYLTDADRAALRATLKQKAFLPAVSEFANGTFWVNSSSNWNPVCNSGLALAALAIGKEDTVAQGIFFNTLQSLQQSGGLAAYAPDGAYAEGIGYWGYSSQYLATLASSMLSAFGEDFDLSLSPGLSETGMFAIYGEGPTGRMVNYGDASDEKIYPTFMTWLSHAYDKPVYAWFTQKHAGHHPLELLWYDSRGVTATPATLPKSRYFRGPELAVFRNAWLDSNASYLAFKAGNPKNEHSHLDVGNFIFDALGKRWALDLGPDSYALPNYFIDYGDSATRFTYYRVRAEGHNTLVVNPGKSEDQEKWPATRITRFDTTRQTAIADIGGAYPTSVSRALRGVSLQNGVNALIQDEIQLKAPGDIWWQMHTEAAVTVAADGKSATLTQGSKRLWLALLAPTAATAKLTVVKAIPLAGTPSPAGQNAEKSISAIALHLTEALQSTITVWLVPLAAGQPLPNALPAVAPLAAANWPATTAIAAGHPAGSVPGVRWERGNLHAMLVGKGAARLQLLAVNGSRLQEIRRDGPGDFVFTMRDSAPRLLLLHWQQGSAEGTLLLNRPL